MEKAIKWFQLWHLTMNKYKVLAHAPIEDMPNVDNCRSIVHKYGLAINHYHKAMNRVLNL